MRKQKENQRNYFVSEYFLHCLVIFFSQEEMRRYQDMLMQEVRDLREQKQAAEKVGHKSWMFFGKDKTGDRAKPFVCSFGLTDAP